MFNEEEVSGTINNGLPTVSENTLADGATGGDRLAEVDLPITELPPFVFARDAAPVLDDVEPEGLQATMNVIFDIEYEGDELFVGRVFKNKEDYKVKIAVHAINRRFSFKRERSNNDYVIVKCLSTTCPWRVYVSRIDQSDYFQVRTATLYHTCAVDVRAQFHRQATTSVISDMMRQRYIGCGIGPRPMEVMCEMLADHSVNVSYWKAWHARELALDCAKGSAAGSYGLLPTYLHMLKEANAGTITGLETELDAAGNTWFKYCFVALGASVRGIQFMRKVFVVNGTHLRGRYMGCLLTASEQDGNFQIFPVAYTIVDSENDKAREWFFKMLKKVIPDNEEVSFVSDRYSSIYGTLNKVYLKANHGVCIVHLQRNVAVWFKIKILAPLVSRAAKAYRKLAFNEHFAEIEKLCPSFAQYLRDIGFHHWMRSHFYGDRYNVMTSKVAKSFNAVLREARELPIVSMLEYIRGTLMAWFTKRRDKAAKHTSTITPKVVDLVHTNFQRSGSFLVLKVNNEKYEVKHQGGNASIVDIREKTCSCKELNMIKIPCPHAVGAAIKADIKVERLVAAEYDTFF